MNPNELRIGNFVNILTPPDPVSIPTGLTIKISEIRFEGVTEMSHNKERNVFFPYQRIDPIPLTYGALRWRGF